MGVSANVIEASFEALLDGLYLALARSGDATESW
jgi:hypothetical protein